MKVGIVGLPNVGKSTLFSALTETQVDCENYPFCTIEPNKAVVGVPDDRLDKLAKLENSEKILPTTIEFLDIAGLVKGAHKGEGLGNQFLSHIREVDAVIHLVRAFENTDITHVSGKVEPEEDKKIILTELILADLEYAQKRVDNIERAAKGDKELKAKLDVLQKIEKGLSEEKLVSDMDLRDEELKLVRDLQFLTQKPFMTVANIDTTDTQIILDGETVPAINVKLEYEISQLPQEERSDYLKEMGLEKSGLERLIQRSYKILNLITFLTVGPKETRAWTVKKNTEAPQAAGRIHSDFEKGFIKAEVIQWKKLLEAKGYAGARERGWLRLEGKDYIVQEGDVVHFRFAK